MCPRPRSSGPSTWSSATPGRRSSTRSVRPAFRAGKNEIAQLPQTEIATRIDYTQQSGYDTHSRQELTHANLRGDFASAVAAFFADLMEANLDDRVPLVSFSEFGRTIQKNDLGGTDHGTVGAMFVADPTVQGGLLGSMPSLTELEKGTPE